MRTLSRRRACLSGAVLAATVGANACAPASGERTPAEAEMYVGLARARAVAVLDAAADRLVRRISLAPLGEVGLPWHIAVSPTGGAAILPLRGKAPTVGVIGTGEGGVVGDGEGEGTTRRSLVGGLPLDRPVPEKQVACVRIQLNPGATTANRAATEVTDRAHALVSDARGQAYVVVGPAAGNGPTAVAVLDLAAGVVRRYLPVAGRGEQVLTLAVQPDGGRLYVALWRWPLAGQGRWSDPAARPAAAGGGRGHARLVVMDTQDGRVRARDDLPAECGAVVRLATAALPGSQGTSGAAGLYVALSDRPPAMLEDDWWYVYSQPQLLIYDAGRLDLLATVPLGERPAGLAVTPDARRAYILSGTAWSGQVTGLDLASGTITRRWPLGGGCLSLAMGPAGKVYAADALNDRLWTIDSQADSLAGFISLPGAPLALGARPTA